MKLRLPIAVIGGTAVLVSLGLTPGVNVEAAAGSTPPAEGTIYALDWSSGMLATVDPATAVTTAIGTTNPVVGGAAAMYVDPATAELVVPSWGQSPYPVYRVSPTDASAIEIQAAGERITGAAATADGTYVTFDDITQLESTFALMDDETGVVTTIAAVTNADGEPERVSALAFCEGLLYAFLYRDNNAVYQLDPATARLTAVLPQTPGVSSVYAADCGPDGTLYASDFDNLVTSPDIATVSLTPVAGFSGELAFTETMAVYVSAETLAGTEPAPEEEANTPPELAETGSPSLVVAIGGALIAVMAGLFLAVARRKPVRT